MKPIIEVKNLSKSYVINHKDRASYSTIKDDFTHLLTSPFEKKESREEKFWALKDVNFEVAQGEIFGVIGRNGSGKSTLLKILSRVVEPTSGEIKLNGRVASLLEVGTGFHPELTGRENVYFNGSMLGLSRKEIQAKFDEIVAFSEVEKFIDTPVKFYSSGMYVRLAFSVAAHLDPEILILDEVLAVGDEAFQKKSMKKIKSTMENGTTVLFVSHSMGSIQQLCSNGLLLDNGAVSFIGSTDELTNRYTELMQSSINEDQIKWTWKRSPDFINNDFFDPDKIYLQDSKGNIIKNEISHKAESWLCIEGLLKTDSPQFNIGYVIKNKLTKTLLYITLSTDTDDKKALKKGKIKFSGKIPGNMLNGGEYTISLISSIHNKFWIFDPGEKTPSVELKITEKMLVSEQWIGTRAGAFAPIIEWKAEKI